MVFCLRMDNVCHTQKGKTKTTTMHLLTWRLLLEIKYISVFPLNIFLFHLCDETVCPRYTRF